MIVGSADDGICSIASLSRNYFTDHCVIDFYPGHRFLKFKLHPKFEGQPVHAVNDGIHPPFRVPGSSFDIGIIHQAVERRCILWKGAQEKNRKLHQLPEFGMLEILVNMFLDRGKHFQPEYPADRLPVHKFSQ